MRSTMSESSVSAWTRWYASSSDCCTRTCSAPSPSSPMATITMVTRTSIMVKPPWRRDVWLRPMLASSVLGKPLPDSGASAGVDDHAARLHARVAGDADHVGHRTEAGEPPVAAVGERGGSGDVVESAHRRSDRLQHRAPGLDAPAVLPVAAGGNDVDGGVALDRF